VGSVSSRPVLVVAAGVVFTAFSAIFIRLSDAHPLVIATYRMGFTTLFLAPLFAVHARRSGERPTKRALGLSILSGLVLAGHFALWITSLSYTSVASATVLVTTHPILVAVLGFLILGEHVGLRGVALMVAAVAGGFLLVWEGLGKGDGSWVGDLLALGGAVTVSIYMLIGRYVRRELSVHLYTMIVYGVAFATLLATTLVARIPLWPYPPRELLLFAALALFCTLLGHSLFNWALRYLPTSVVSTSILGEPVIASILAIVLFSELPTPTTLAGGAVILASIFLFVRLRARTRT
jgi:drug/metabolite transporter (DMT)-like permease